MALLHRPDALAAPTTLLDDPTTLAIASPAPAAAEWPWLAPIGPLPRGDAYTYDWIENLLGLARS